MHRHISYLECRCVGGRRREKKRVEGREEIGLSINLLISSTFESGARKDGRDPKVR